jgi:transcriptional regulator with XRE-family HTH domain
VPFCHLTFLVDRPLFRPNERVEGQPGTLGAAFQERRWSRGLKRSEAAKEIGVSVATYLLWETNRSEPDLRNISRAIRFLGRDWRPQGASLGDRIRQTRTAVGLPIKQLAIVLTTDPSTISK